MAVGLVSVLQADEPALAAQSPCTTVFPGYTAGLTTVNGGPYNASTNPYKISTEEELVYLSWATSSANEDDTDASVSPPKISRSHALQRSYRQTENLDLESCLWSPIGVTGNEFSSVDRFTGIFDGGSAEIRNLKVEQATALFTGFFGVVEGAKLRNINLINVDVAYTNPGTLLSDQKGTGGLAGSASNTEIVNCHVTGRIASSNRFTGGLVGATNRLDGTSISRSSAVASVTSDNSSSVGGLVGIVNRTLSISTSFASGSVSGVGTLGGLIGDGANSITIQDSYSSASVSATGLLQSDRAGGLIGQIRANPNVTITNSYARGQITGNGDKGGLIGTYVFGTMNVSNTFWDREGSGVNTSGGGFGLPKTRAEMQSFETFGPSGAGWNITEDWTEFDSSATPPQIWGICSGSTHPFLLWEYENSPCVFPQSEKVAPASELKPERRASAPAIHLDLQVSVGERISGAPVVIGGEGLAGGSDYSLVVRSTPQVVDSGKATSLGNFSKQVSMPALAPGAHTLTLSALAPDGSTLTLVQRFTIGADGTVTALNSPEGSVGSRLAATGSDQLVMLWSVGLAMLMMVAGVSAVAASRTKRAHAEG